MFVGKKIEVQLFGGYHRAYGKPPRGSPRYGGVMSMT